MQDHAIGGGFFWKEGKKRIDCEFPQLHLEECMKRQKLEGAGRHELEEAGRQELERIERWELEGSERQQGAG
jgi:hypothetical protein